MCTLKSTEDKVINKRLHSKSTDDFGPEYVVSFFICVLFSTDLVFACFVLSGLMLFVCLFVWCLFV